MALAQAIDPRGPPLILHELATNALKHGALSAAGGRVDLNRAVTEDDDGPALNVAWTEHGGPPAAEPAKVGLGS